tara:strand:- start:3884 stop:4300 length:417 start_codon:yes stop_codon:yes gene_type:complete
MPISLSFTEGSVSKEVAQEAASRVTKLFLELHSLYGNAVMGPGVTNQVTFIPKEFSLSNGQPFVGAWVEAKVPRFALSTPELKKDFLSQSVDIIEGLANGSINRSDIHGNAVYAEDGAWILGGEAMTNEEILAAVSKG